MGALLSFIYQGERIFSGKPCADFVHGIFLPLKRMIMRLGDYAVRPTFADEKRKADLTDNNTTGIVQLMQTT